MSTLIPPAGAARPLPDTYSPTVLALARAMAAAESFRAGATAGAAIDEAEAIGR